MTPSQSLPPRPLDKDECDAYRGLGLPPGDWAPLLVVPYLETFVDLLKDQPSNSSHLWHWCSWAMHPFHVGEFIRDLEFHARRLIIECEWPNIESDWRGRYTTVSTLRQLFFVDETPRQDQVAKARRLLCWHLAKDFPKNRDEDLLGKIIDKHSQLYLIDSRDHERAARCLEERVEELRATSYDFMTLSWFKESDSEWNCPARSDESDLLLTLIIVALGRAFGKGRLTADHMDRLGAEVKR
jgi:hypothetical protein